MSNDVFPGPKLPRRDGNGNDIPDGFAVGLWAFRKRRPIDWKAIGTWIGIAITVGGVSGIYHSVAKEVGREKELTAVGFISEQMPGFHDTPDPDKIGWWADTWYGWLSEQRSARTRREYRRYGLAFRDELRRADAFADLLLPPAPPVMTIEQRATYDSIIVAHRKLTADTARTWANTSQSPHKPLSASAHNVRLAALGSFYGYALRNEAYAGGVNPIDRVKRQKRDLYGHAHVLDISDGAIDEQLAAIPATPIGMRDRAILAVTLYTGRRLAEIAGLRCGSITRQKNGSIKLEFGHTKGGGTAENTLPGKNPAARALITWLTTHYGSTWPVQSVAFPSLSRNSHGREQRPMSATALESIAAKHIGTSRFHALRHTFALAMMEDGASLFELQEALGHSNPAITGVYAQHLKRGQNQHIEGLVTVYAGQHEKKKA